MPLHLLPPLRSACRAAVALLLVVGVTAAGSLTAGADTVRPVPTTEARRAGVEPGNAAMGWRFRQQESDRQRLARTDAARADASAAFTPSGVLGIDVSSHQRRVDWESWVDRGRTFAYIKATEGTSYRNPYFAAQYDGAYDAGMIRGAYHFASPSGRSGKAQAAYFVARGGGWVSDGRTLPGVLDIEYNPYGATCYGLSKARMIRWITDFTVEYKRLTKRDAVIYTTADWWQRCTGNTTKFTNTNPLWAARYGTRNPGKLPGAWEWATFWQYTSRPIDQNRFSSTPARLKVLATGIEP